MVQLGKFIQASGEIPAGSDADTGWRVLDAPPDQNVALNSLNCFGGDTNEMCSFFQVPTNSTIDSSTKVGDIAGSLQICAAGGYLLTQLATQTDSLFRAHPYSTDGGRGPVGPLSFPIFVLPAGYSLVIACTAANTNAIYAQAGGFLCPVAY